MRLAEWIKLKKLSRTEVAAELRVSPAYVTNLCSEQPNWPSRALILRIHHLTEGAVTSADFLTPVRKDEAAA